MTRLLTNKLLFQEAKNFPIRKFLKSDGSINTRKIKLLHPDFRQDALDCIFINKAMEVHGEFFGYEEVEFKTMSQQVNIYCPDCDTYFKQIAKYHLEGSGCPNCKHKSIERKTEYGNFVVPCIYHNYKVKDGFVVFYSGRGKEIKFLIAKD